MTAQEMINAALRLIQVKASGQTISSEEASDGLEALNTMLHEWELNGVPVYHSDLSLADDIELEDNHLKAVKYNLAVELSPEYGVIPSPVIASIALSSYRTLERHYIDVDELDIDDALNGISYYNGILDR